MRITGSITALATPFDASGELDLDAWHRHIALQLERGTEALVIAGSTGEAAALFDAEYDTLLRTAVEIVAGRVPVLAGTGLSSTLKTIELTRRAAALGADAALVVTPPYVRPTQAGLVAHYCAVADDGALPVVLYNVPGRTGTDMLPETVGALASHPRIVGIKEAHTDESRMDALLAFKSADFTVLSGDDPTACRAMLAGADGIVSVASNVLPASFRRLCELARAEREVDATEWDARLVPACTFLGVEPNPIPVKALLERQGIGRGLRLPLTSLSDRYAAEAARIDELVRALERECVESPAT
ncbi:4-hydroxy-tetrahydrodipicolinate synthase [Cognatilysobacter bugurensis]|uniref:4-hydroxy-tetrahydrodipicolinate synthase n=1 Tax=Cognatilysobacter bugurensis TaxID=543356 RepID=A0A918W5L9_9GAMM|nr:4-hydroxy-tetrahydrodipicolinate synthase [Lysobacter bugurensis]GHA74565.1 4-hydroxy-tetrahydrodipicolinate synthase [Lysobacter bugurensis]